MSQLTFSWPLKASYAASDFILSPSNAEAAAFLEAWPDGRTSAALLSGPKASGKTHLAAAWAERNKAVMIDAKSVGSKDSAALWCKAKRAVLENIDSIADETAFFHLLRHAETHQLCLLVTAEKTAQYLPFTLADLTSRLRAIPAVTLLDPDDALLRGFLFKCFTDRQLRVGNEVVDFLLKRIERSFESAQNMVVAVEKYAAERKRPITIALVKSLLG